MWVPRWCPVRGKQECVPVVTSHTLSLRVLGYNMLATPRSVSYGLSFLLPSLNPALITTGICATLQPSHALPTAYPFIPAVAFFHSSLVHRYPSFQSSPYHSFHIFLREFSRYLFLQRLRFARRDKRYFWAGERKVNREKETICPAWGHEVWRSQQGGAWVKGVINKVTCIRLVAASSLPHPHSPSHQPPHIPTFPPSSPHLSLVHSLLFPPRPKPSPNTPAP